MTVTPAASLGQMASGLLWAGPRFFVCGFRLVSSRLVVAVASPLPIQSKTWGLNSFVLFDALNRAWGNFFGGGLCLVGARVVATVAVYLLSTRLSVIKTKQSKIKRRTMTLFHQTKRSGEILGHGGQSRIWRMVFNLTRCPPPFLAGLEAASRHLAAATALAGSPLRCR